MTFGRTRFGGTALLSAAALALLLPACGPRKPKDTNAIVPKVQVSRMKVPLKSAIEVTYAWECEPTMKKLTDEHRVFVHFVDKTGTVLFTDDHLPIPSVVEWQPGQTYSYRRTVFVPNYSYTGPVDIRLGLEPVAGARKLRVALKAEDVGLREYRLLRIEFAPETESIYVFEKDGWHDPETSPDNPSLERTWTKKDATISFKNPQKDVILYLEADTNYKVFPKPPVLTVSVGGTKGIVIPIQDAEVFLKRIRFKAADLGSGDFVDLRLSMNQTFNPEALGLNEDSRTLGLMVHHLNVVEADQVGSLPPDAVVDAGPLPPAVVAELKASAAAATSAPATKGVKPGVTTAGAAKSAPVAKSAPAAKAAGSPAKPAPKK
jgi:hypothetical protein